MNLAAVFDLLVELRERGVLLRVRDDRLRYHPRGMVDAVTMSRLTEAKTTLVHLLRLVGEDSGLEPNASPLPRVTFRGLVRSPLGVTSPATTTRTSVPRTPRVTRRGGQHQFPYPAISKEKMS